MTFVEGPDSDSSTSTVATGDEGLRRLESLMLASDTIGEVDWGHVRPAETDSLAKGTMGTPRDGAHHDIREHVPLQDGEESHNVPRGELQLTSDILQCLTDTFGDVMFNAGDLEGDDNNSTETSSDEDHSGSEKTGDDSRSEVSSNDDPNGDAQQPQGNEEIIMTEMLSGQARADEVLQQCHLWGRQVDGYRGGWITTYPDREVVLLRFVDVLDEDDNEIFEGPHVVVDHEGTRGGRRIRRAHRYILDQYVEEHESHKIIFMTLSIEQEALLLLEELHPGEGEFRWDTSWGTFPVPAAYPDNEFTRSITNGRNPAVTEILTGDYPRSSESMVDACDFMLRSPLSVLSDRALMHLIMDIEMDWENLSNEVAILHMAWRFSEGVHTFGSRTREEAADILIAFANDRIPPIGSGVETTVPPQHAWLQFFATNDLRFCP